MTSKRIFSKICNNFTATAFFRIYFPISLFFRNTRFNVASNTYATISTEILNLSAPILEITAGKIVEKSSFVYECVPHKDVFKSNPSFTKTGFFLPFWTFALSKLKSVGSSKCNHRVIRLK